MKITTELLKDLLEQAYTCGRDDCNLESSREDFGKDNGDPVGFEQFFKDLNLDIDHENE